LTVLVDTSALHAALDADDEFHESARLAFAQLSNVGESLLTHNYVVLETIALAQRRLGLDAVRAFIDNRLPALEVVWIERGIHEEACSRLLGQASRQVSLVDWVSFTVMRRLDIEVALAFDDDFGDHGFRTIPA
jgi:predicted nucleic acid-binding protein